MTSFGGAPIMNNGYYDVPIHNQYSNEPYHRNNQNITNTYQVNRTINRKINNNKETYMVYNEPDNPSPSLYYETDQPMSGYYQDPMYISSDAGLPLMKKKEIMYGDNNKQYIESFNNSVELVGRGETLGPGSGYTLGPGRNIGTGYLNPQFIPNVSRNYWSYNDPGYTNYYFVPPPIDIVQREPPMLYRPQSRPVQNNYLEDDEVEIEVLKEDVKNIVKESKKNKKNKNKNNKNDKKSKESKKQVDSKTLWNIIIVLAFIIFCFLLKLLYDYKVIRLNFKR
jgi:hypothetical protein